MSHRLTALTVTLLALPSVAIACSCMRPQDLTEQQIRSLLKDVSLIARGRVVAVAYPLGCRIAPLRWAYAVTGTRLPVTYSIAIRETLLGTSGRTTTVVQQQVAELDGCKPLGSAACEPALPPGDALWVLNRMPSGEQRFAGRCGQMLAPYLLRMAQRSS